MADNAAFLDALAYVLEWEGGYVNDPRDPGGATNMGITQATLSNWLGRQVTPSEVASLDAETAKAIYRQNYWRAAHCDELDDALAFAVFDSAVNQGVYRAITLLQDAAGTSVDGIFGPNTRNAVEDSNPWDLLRDFQAKRARHYASLHHFDRYGYGWMRRLVETSMEAAMFLGGPE